MSDDSPARAGLISVAVSSLAGIIALSVVAGDFMGRRDIELNIEPEAADLAKYGRLTPELYCEQVANFTGRLDEYFTARSNGEHPPPFTIGVEECKTALKTIAQEPKPQP